MSSRVVLMFTIGAVVLLLLIGCGAPAPVPATPIPTLVPATLPPQPTATLLPAALQVTFPSRRPSTQVASGLYQQYCANCHGPSGTGIVPGARDLSDSDYLRGQTPIRIYQIISEGRRAMPGWQDKLSVDERWDLTFYIWHFVTPPGMLEQGKTIYQQKCIACHGPDGKGAVPGTPNFTSVEWAASRAPLDIFKIVTEGREAMPAWQGQLTPEERWAAIEYVRTLACEPSAASTTASLPSR